MPLHQECIHVEQGRIGDNLRGDEETVGGGREEERGREGRRREGEREGGEEDCEREQGELNLDGVGGGFHDEDGGDNFKEVFRTSPTLHR